MPQSTIENEVVDNGHLRLLGQPMSRYLIRQSRVMLCLAIEKDALDSEYLRCMVYRMSLYPKQYPQNVPHSTIESDVVLDEASQWSSKSHELLSETMSLIFDVALPLRCMQQKASILDLFSRDRTAIYDFAHKLYHALPLRYDHQKAIISDN
jgi:hypothetical protein